MHKHETLFTAEFEVTGPGVRRVLQTLARKGLMLSVVREADLKEYVTGVVETAIDGDPCRLLLDQPANNADSRIVFAAGDVVRIAWSNMGVRFGARGRMISVRTAESVPAYEVRVDGAVYRQQRRKAFRVPVGPKDSVNAELVMHSSDGALTPKIKDLSETGCRLSLEIDRAFDAGLEPGVDAVLSVQFAGRSGAIASNVRIVWTERANNEIMDAGAAWVNPKGDFMSSIRRFVIQKERTLLQRRAGH